MCVVCADNQCEKRAGVEDFPLRPFFDLLDKTIAPFFSKTAS